MRIWFIILIVLVLFITGCSSQPSIQCRMNSDCKSVGGCIVGCYNKYHLPTQPRDEMCGQLGPFECSCIDSVCVDTGGGINVLYYDNRNYSCDSSYDVYLSRSTDGGNTWSDNKMSTQTFKPHPVPGSSVYWGDFITIIAVNNTLYCSWMADYTGLYQAWMRIQDITTIGIKQINSEVPDKYSLSQNYPNPFNPSTNIKYQIPNNGFVKLTVFDILGHTVETLVNQKQSAGTYEVEWDGSKYPSGVYFYQLNTESFSQTKKLMLVK